MNLNTKIEIKLPNMGRTVEGEDAYTNILKSQLRTRRNSSQIKKMILDYTKFMNSSLEKTHKSRSKRKMLAQTLDYGRSQSVMREPTPYTQNDTLTQKFVIIKSRSNSVNKPPWDVKPKVFSTLDQPSIDGVI